MPREHAERVRVAFALPDGAADAGALEAKLQPADAGKDGADRQHGGDSALASLRPAGSNATKNSTSVAEGTPARDG